MNTSGALASMAAGVWQPERKQEASRTSANGLLLYVCVAHLASWVAAWNFTHRASLNSGG